MPAGSRASVMPTSGCVTTLPAPLPNNFRLERKTARTSPTRESFLRVSAPLIPLERSNKNSKTDPSSLARDRLTVSLMIHRLASHCVFLQGSPGGDVIPAMLMPALSLTRASALLQTQVQYADNLFLFCDYLEERGITLRSVEDLDYALSYFGHRYCASPAGSKSYFGNILSSIGLFFPRLRRELPTAWATFEGWATLRPSKQRLPMPEQIRDLIVADLCARDKFRVAATVWTGFHTWMRKEELGSVRRDDYIAHMWPVASSDPARRIYGVFRLDDNKAGLVQSVTVTDRDLHTLLLRLKQSLSRGTDRLFVSGATLAAHIVAASERLGFGELRFTPHSLRHGGATAAILAGMPAEDVRLRGRWANLSTVLRYVQSGVVAKLVDSLPVTLLSRARDIGSRSLLPLFGASAPSA